MNVIIRRMRLEDVPAVHEIDTLSFSLPWPERSFQFEVADNTASRPWVAELDVDTKPRVVGMLVLWLLAEEIHIATLAVHPEFRQHGIGERIIIESLRSAHAEGARRAFLEVRRGNTAAQSMYRKLGFTMDGIRPHYYQDNGEDALLMTLEGLTEDFGLTPESNSLR